MIRNLINNSFVGIPAEYKAFSNQNEDNAEEQLQQQQLGGDMQMGGEN